MTCKTKRKRKRSQSVVGQKPQHPQTNPKRNMTTQTRHQNFDYTTIADRLRAVCWGNNSRPTGVVKSHIIRYGQHACQQGTLTLPDTWFRPPLWDLLVIQLLRPNSSNLPCLYLTFHLEYPLVLSRFCSL